MSQVLRFSSMSGTEYIEIMSGLRQMAIDVIELRNKVAQTADLIEAARDVTKDPDDPLAMSALRVHLEYFGGAETDGTRRVSRFRKDSIEEAF